jgi:hypothetical protein
MPPEPICEPMKFVAVAQAVGITKDAGYHGSIVLETEPRSNTSPPSNDHKIKIIVFNDDGRWHKYPAHYFVPVQDV